MEPALNGDAIQNKNESNRAVGPKVMAIYIWCGLIFVMFETNMVQYSIGGEEGTLV